MQAKQHLSKQRQKLYAFLVIKYSVLENINVFIDLLCLSQTKTENESNCFYDSDDNFLAMMATNCRAPSKSTTRGSFLVSSSLSRISCEKLFCWYSASSAHLLSNSLSILLSSARTINAFCPLSLLTFDCCRLHQGLLPALQPSVPQ